MKLADIVAIVSKAVTPHAETQYHLYSLPSFDEGKTYEVVDGSYIQSNKYVVPNRCILFNKLNVRFKRVWRINDKDEHKLCSTEFLPLVVDEEKVDYQYCYYLLISDRITNYLCGQNSNTSGSHKRIDPSNFLDIDITLPSIMEQKHIGKLLSDIDQKIALNRAINRNLEAMAKQLYDYWFVQFDFPNADGKPYKSSGGAMVWNEKLKREIPKGWNCTLLGDLCNMYQPQTLGLNDLNACGEYRVYGANGIIGKYDRYNHESSEIAMACRGNSCGVLNRTQPRSWITGNAMVIQMKDPKVHNEWIKQALHYTNIKGAISGSGQPQLARENLQGINILQPQHSILIAFSNVIRPIIESCLQVERESDILTKKRDELLPLLMNGQAMVNCDLSHG